MAKTDTKPASAPRGKPVGRPSLYGERMRDHSVKFTDAQWAAFLALGGPEWLRTMIQIYSTPAELATRQENES